MQWISKSKYNTPLHSQIYDQRGIGAPCLLVERMTPTTNWFPSHSPATMQHMNKAALRNPTFFLQ